MPGMVLLVLVILQRLGELVYANANTKRLLASGAVEYEAGHYVLLVLVHAGWIITLLWLAPGEQIIPGFFIAYLGLQIFRLWVFVSLGRRWTTRIVVVPGEKLVRKGPYRFFRHPNYMVVIGEIACLPLVFGLWKTAVIFSILNLFALAIRIRAEEKALAPLRKN